MADPEALEAAAILEFMEKRPTMMAREDAVGLARACLRHVENGDSSPAERARLDAVAFGVGWMSGDLLPAGWLECSRAGRLASLLYQTGVVRPENFEDVYSLLVMTGLDDTKREKFLNRCRHAWGRFGHFSADPEDRDIIWLRSPERAQSRR